MFWHWGTILREMSRTKECNLGTVLSLVEYDHSKIYKVDKQKITIL